jgi:hypothetical protein
MKILSLLFAEDSPQAAGGGFSVTLDIAALLWPLAVAAILILYRKEILELLIHVDLTLQQTSNEQTEFQRPD